MRSINCVIKGAMLGGMVLVLSTSPALASGANKVLDEKPKVEINKVEIKKVEKAMLLEKKSEEKLGVLRINRLGIDRINLLVDEDILGVILEDED